MRLTLTLGVLGVVMTLGIVFAFIPPQPFNNPQPNLLLTVTVSPTAAPISEVTETSESSSLDEVLANARAFTGTNEDWKTMYPDGFIYEFEDEISMVLVPAGCFTMGSTEEQIDYTVSLFPEVTRDAYTDETPTTHVCFAEPFWIDLVEVTQGDFVRLDGQAADENYFEGDNRPRESITWAEALAFCQSRGVRLPTESEWEYAARGPESLIFPWGNEFIADNVVYRENSDDQTADVGSRPEGRSWVGAYDLAGNVWEWLSTLYIDYPYPTDANGFVVDTGQEDLERVYSRTLRGGAWLSSSNHIHPAARNWSFRNDGDATTGFRCARDLESE
jgi:formylglycine-generating enzyme required for sulfatase activity